MPQGKVAESASRSSDVQFRQKQQHRQRTPERQGDDDHQSHHLHVSRPRGKGGVVSDSETRAKGADKPEWKPVSCAPFGVWLRTKRQGENGENVCAKRRGPNPGDEPEWIEQPPHGRTTITHSTFLPPTHWSPL